MAAVSVFFAQHLCTLPARAAPVCNGQADPGGPFWYCERCKNKLKEPNLAIRNEQSHTHLSWWRSHTHLSWWRERERDADAGKAVDVVRRSPQDGEARDRTPGNLRTGAGFRAEVHFTSHLQLRLDLCSPQRTLTTAHGAASQKHPGERLQAPSYRVPGRVVVCCCPDAVLDQQRPRP